MKALMQRVARLQVAIHGPRRRITVIQEGDTANYWLDGAPATREQLDLLAGDGHTLVIRQIPEGYIDFI